MVFRYCWKQGYYGAVLQNKDMKFHYEDVFVKVENNNTPFTGFYKEGEVIRLPIACKYGNYYADDKTLQQLQADGNIIFRIVMRMEIN